MTTITSASFIKTAAKNHQSPTDDRPEFVMIGRSNVGKSSLINAMCNDKSLALTSSKPGKTALINYFDIVSRDDDKTPQSRYLVDLPGYGYAKVSKTTGAAWGTMIIDYLMHKTNLVHIFVLIDSNIPPQEIDLGFVQWLHEIDKPFSIVYTKTDKGTQKQTNYNIKQSLLAISQTIGYTPQHYKVSAIKTHSTAPITTAIHEVVASLSS